MIKKLGPLSRITYFSVKISKFLLLLRRCIEIVFQSKTFKSSKREASELYVTVIGYSAKCSHQCNPWEKNDQDWFSSLVAHPNPSRGLLRHPIFLYSIVTCLTMCIMIHLKESEMSIKIIRFALVIPTVSLFERQIISLNSRAENQSLSLQCTYHSSEHTSDAISQVTTKYHYLFNN